MQRGGTRLRTYAICHASEVEFDNKDAGHLKISDRLIIQLWRHGLVALWGLARCMMDYGRGRHKGGTGDDVAD